LCGFALNPDFIISPDGVSLSLLQSARTTALIFFRLVLDFSPLKSNWFVSPLSFFSHFLSGDNDFFRSTSLGRDAPGSSAGTQLLRLSVSGDFLLSSLRFDLCMPGSTHGSIVGVPFWQTLTFRAPPISLFSLYPCVVLILFLFFDQLINKWHLPCRCWLDPALEAINVAGSFVEPRLTVKRSRPVLLRFNRRSNLRLAPRR